MTGRRMTNKNISTMDEYPVIEPFTNLPAGEFAAIAADPAWSFKAYTPLTEINGHGRRDAGRHYRVMSLDAIKALPVASVARRDAHLFLWVPGPHLAQGFEVLKAWGFKYSAIAFVWIKLRASFDRNAATLLPPFYFDDDFHVGLGHTTRKNAELCLLGRRGSPRRVSRDVRELIIAPRREHSRKPDEAYERIMQYARGPYLELFSRQRRSGWTVWGNEVERFEPRHTGGAIMHEATPQ